MTCEKARERHPGLREIKKKRQIALPFTPQSVLL